MLSIILAIILGVLFTLVATQNPLIVPISFFGTEVALPLYIVAAFSFLGGILLSLIFRLLDATTYAVSTTSLESKLRDQNSVIQRLNSDLEKVSTENMRLKDELNKTNNILQNTKVSERRDNIKDFFGRIRQNFNL